MTKFWVFTNFANFSIKKNRFKYRHMGTQINHLNVKKSVMRMKNFWTWKVSSIFFCQKWPKHHQRSLFRSCLPQNEFLGIFTLFTTTQCFFLTTFQKNFCFFFFENICIGAWNEPSWRVKCDFCYVKFIGDWFLPEKGT